MRFPKNKSRVEEVVKEDGIFHLMKYVTCMLPQTPLADSHSHSTDPEPHPASLTWKQAAPRRSSAPNFPSEERET